MGRIVKLFVKNIRSSRVCKTGLLDYSKNPYFVTLSFMQDKQASKLNKNVFQNVMSTVQRTGIF